MIGILEHIHKEQLELKDLNIYRLIRNHKSFRVFCSLFYAIKFFGLYCSASARCEGWIDSLSARSATSCCASCAPVSADADTRAPRAASGSCTARCRRLHQRLTGRIQCAELVDVSRTHSCFRRDPVRAKPVPLPIPCRLHPCLHRRAGFPKSRVRQLVVLNARHLDPLNSWGRCVDVDPVQQRIGDSFLIFGHHHI